MNTYNETNKQIRVLSDIVNLDERYGVWSNVNDANNNIPKEVRKPGLTVGIDLYNDDNIIEYWYNNGIENENLVIKNPSDQNSIKVVNNIEDLKELQPITNQIILCKGYHNPNDSGGGIFYGVNYQIKVTEDITIENSKTINIEPLFEKLYSGQVLEFTEGGIFTITQNANIGATSIQGDLTVANVSNNETAGLKEDGGMVFETTQSGSFRWKRPLREQTFASDFGVVSGGDVSGNFENLMAYINKEKPSASLVFPEGEIDLTSVTLQDVESDIFIQGNNTTLKGNGEPNDADLFHFKRQFEVTGVKFDSWRFPMGFEELGLLDGERSEYAIVKGCQFNSVYSPMKAWGSVTVEEDVHYIDKVEFSDNYCTNLVDGLKIKRVGVNEFVADNNIIDGLNFNDRNLLRDFPSIFSPGDFADETFYHNTISKVTNNTIKNIFSENTRIYVTIFYRGDHTLTFNKFENIKGAKDAVTDAGVSAIYSRGVGNGYIKNNRFINCSNNSGTGAVIAKRGEDNITRNKWVYLEDNYFLFTDEYKNDSEAINFDPETDARTVDHTAFDFTKMNTVIKNNEFHNCSPFNVRGEGSQIGVGTIKTNLIIEDNEIIECVGMPVYFNRLFQVYFKRNKFSFSNNYIINTTESNFSIYFDADDDFDTTDEFKFNDNTFLLSNHIEAGTTTAQSFIQMNGVPRNIEMSGNSFINKTPDKILILLRIIGNDSDTKLIFNKNEIEGFSRLTGTGLNDSSIIVLDQQGEYIEAKENIINDEIYKFIYTGNVSGTIDKMNVSGNTFNGITLGVSNAFRFDDGEPTELIVENNFGLPYKLERDIATTTHTLTLGDTYRTLNFTSADPVTLTIPDLAISKPVKIVQVGAGQITLTGGTGVTLNKKSSKQLLSEEANAVVFIEKTDTDEYLIYGDLADTV